MSKYLVTLEIESDKKLDRILQAHFGAIVICADDNWKVIHTEGIEE